MPDQTIPTSEVRIRARRDEEGGAGTAFLNFAAMLLNLGIAAWNISTETYYLLPINIGFALLSLGVGLWALTW